MMGAMKRRRQSVQTGRERRRLIESIGHAISRFQDSSNAFDDVAAEILAVDRRDLSFMTMLLFGGPA